jgi:chaperonin GroES|tara:strand:+ start:307 stop:600 length:294 start_codon:yes stop_codon:yes gene_type:complete
MKLKPVNDKIVVKPNENNEEETTESGIILPDTVDQGKLMEGKVVAASDGMYSATGTIIPLVVSEGDTILYNKHAQIHEYDNDLVIMSVNEVLSVVEE